jgi:hypothetical protein
MTDSKYAAFTALDPFFDIVQQGLDGLVDGAHYFDTIADDAVFEFKYIFPGWPQRLDSREALMTLYAGYGENIILHSADALITNRSQDPPRRHNRIRVSWQNSQNRRIVRQPLHLSCYHQESQDRAMAGLHGLPGGDDCA